MRTSLTGSTLLTSSGSFLLPLTPVSSSYSPGWTAFLFHQDEGSVEETSAARTWVCPGSRGGRWGAARGVTSLIIVVRLRRRTGGEEGKVRISKRRWMFLRAVCAYHLCACAAWWRGGVVCPGDGQVITAPLSPQTLDIKRGFPTWRKTAKQMACVTLLPPLRVRSLWLRSDQNLRTGHLVSGENTFMSRHQFRLFVNEQQNNSSYLWVWQEAAVCGSSSCHHCNRYHSYCCCRSCDYRSGLCTEEAHQGNV